MSQNTVTAVVRRDKESCADNNIRVQGLSSKNVLQRSTVHVTFGLRRKMLTFLTWKKNCVWKRV